MKYKIGTILHASFLIVFGLNLVLKLTFEGIGYVIGGLAIAAGICMLIDK